MVMIFMDKEAKSSHHTYDKIDILIDPWLVYNSTRLELIDLWTYSKDVHLFNFSVLKIKLRFISKWTLSHCQWMPPWTAFPSGFLHMMCLLQIPTLWRHHCFCDRKEASWEDSPVTNRSMTLCFRSFEEDMQLENSFATSPTFTWNMLLQFYFIFTFLFFYFFLGSNYIATSVFIEKCYQKIASNMYCDFITSIKFCTIFYHNLIIYMQSYYFILWLYWLYSHLII